MAVFLRRLCLSLALCSALFLGVVFATETASAGTDLFGPEVCKPGSSDNSAACSGDGTNNVSGPGGVILAAANLIAIISGVAAVIMIMIGGFMLVTAGGDTNRLGTAKKTIIYAVVGLVVIFLARSIVAFVINRVIVD